MGVEYQSCTTDTQYVNYTLRSDINMKVITKQDRIRDAIASFRKMWGNGSYGADQRGVAVGFELGLLNADKATAEDVNTLIGNASWTRLECDECKKDSEAVIEIGDKPNYESNTAYICVDCIRDAFELHNIQLGILKV